MAQQPVTPSHRLRWLQHHTDIVSPVYASIVQAEICIALSEVQQHSLNAFIQLNMLAAASHRGLPSAKRSILTTSLKD